MKSTIPYLHKTHKQTLEKVLLMPMNFMQERKVLISLVESNPKLKIKD